jgi:methylamine utilization protein MauE
MLNLVDEIQVGLLAVLLISGSAAKLWHASGAGSPGHATGPTAMFPVRLRRSAATALCATEFTLGAGLLLTAGSAGAGGPAVVVRAATFVLFCTAVGALHELRGHRPDAGCGCFGELSRTPVSWRAITRAALLCVAALAAIGAPPVRMPRSAGQAWVTLAVAGAELALLAVLSPEVGQLMIRLSHAEPCELREVPVDRTLSALRSSASWRRYRQFLVTTVPADVWREGCWRFVVFPGVLASRQVEVVFAVYLASRHGPVRVGVLDTGADLDGPWSGRSGSSQDPLALSTHV